MLAAQALLLAGDPPAQAAPAGGRVVVWGDDTSGQTDVPPGLTGVVAVAAGGDQSLALKSDGRVVAWGCAGPPSPTTAPCQPA